MKSRRAFLNLAAAGAANLLRAEPEADPWSAVPGILQRIKPPVFPDRQFDITRYGAKDGGAIDCSVALRQAIAACNQAGGGRVVVPSGVFLTGPIHLKSNVNLVVSPGATLQFSRKIEDYLPVVLTRFEGLEYMGYSPFIYTLEQENVAITGGGTLDGQADCDHWLSWAGKGGCGSKSPAENQRKDRNALMELAERDVPVADRQFGAGHYLRPQFVQPYRCKNVLIEGITVRNSPMYELHPVLCRNVTIRNVKISSHGPNNDGCDPESCTDVLIENCEFDTGDDCIAIKSGRNRDGRRVGVACENLVIRGCRMRDGHGGVTVGSEMSGNVRNVFVEDCQMDSPHLNIALRLKTNAVRGGIIENVRMRNVTAGQVADSVLQIDFFYEEGDKGTYKPVVRGIEMKNVTCRKSKYALYLRGFSSAHIQDVRLDHCAFENVAKPDVIENVDGLNMRAVTINGKTADRT